MLDLIERLEDLTTRSSLDLIRPRLRFTSHTAIHQNSVGFSVGPTDGPASREAHPRSVPEVS
jgi:hypothetical protein